MKPPFIGLSERELRVFSLLARGFTIKQIAAAGVIGVGASRLYMIKNKIARKLKTF